MLRNVLPGAILLAMIVASFLGLFLAWTSRQEIVGVLSLRSSRKVIAHIGLFAVIARALLFIALWTRLVRYHFLLSQSANLELSLRHRLDYLELRYFCVKIQSFEAQPDSLAEKF
jgi:hypothetical protein